MDSSFIQKAQATSGIAAWVSVVIAAVGLVIQNVQKGSDQSNWPRAMVYIAFLTLLAAIVSPYTPNEMRYIFVPVFVMILVWMFFAGFKR